MRMQQKRNNYRMIQAVTGSLLLAGFITNAQAGAIADLTGYDINETSLFKNNAITMGGWVNTGITLTLQVQQIDLTVPSLLATVTAKYNSIN